MIDRFKHTLINRSLGTTRLSFICDYPKGFISHIAWQPI